MDQEQIDVVGAELGQRPVERLARFVWLIGRGLVWDTRYRDQGVVTLQILRKLIESSLNRRDS